jgi:hypothetical protein
MLAILWPPVLVVDEAGVPEENHHPWGINLYLLFTKPGVTHIILVIGLYELLGNPTN